MRNLEEINLDIMEIREKIHELEGQYESLKDERCERMFADFCYLYGVKKGDIVRTKRNRNVIIDGMEERWDGWVMVRKIRKNSEPSKTVEHMLPNEFEDCEVIGHVDDN